MERDTRPSRRSTLIALLIAALVGGAALVGLLLSRSPRGPEAPPAPPAPRSAQGSVLHGETVHLLIVGDPFALAMEKAAEKLDQLSGGHLELEVVGYDDVRRLTLLNSRDMQSAYDLISFDSVWLGEYSSAGVLLPLEELIASERHQVEPEDFLDIAYTQARHGEHQFGLPIQTHPELLWYRKDLFAADGLQPPRTTKELLEVARHFNRPQAGQYGVLWNGQRG